MAEWQKVGKQRGPSNHQSDALTTESLDSQQRNGSKSVLTQHRLETSADYSCVSLSYSWLHYPLQMELWAWEEYPAHAQSLPEQILSLSTTLLSLGQLSPYVLLHNT